MGLIEKIFKKTAAEKAGVRFQTLTAQSPEFRRWDGKLYENELVRAAVHAIAIHCAKLQAQFTGSAQSVLVGKLAKAPNGWQTWSQFLYRTATILEMQNNVFIVPVRNNFGDAVGIYPILPDRCELVEYAGKLFIRFAFGDGKYAAEEYDKCAVLTKFQYTDDFLGDTNRALTPTMQLINIQRQGIEENVKNAASYRFMAQYDNFLTPKDLAKERKRFTKENLQNGDGGLLLFPNTYANIKQIDMQSYTVNEKQMERIETNVFDYFGVNRKIIQNNAYGDEWQAFFTGKIEPFAIQLSDALTKMLFSPRERAQGNSIYFTENQLRYLSNAEKLNISSSMADRGIFNRDEVREIWNKPPIPNGAGKAYTIRGEYYLLGEDGDSKKEEEKPNAGND